MMKQFACDALPERASAFANHPGLCRFLLDAVRGASLPPPYVIVVAHLGPSLHGGTHVFSWRIALDDDVPDSLRPHVRDARTRHPGILLAYARRKGDEALVSFAPIELFPLVRGGIA